ncbi:hypothetical protein TNCV_1648991 [Trichonephila clavipes]|nr:hypothetical protein TNCV_1648991 [Trichonephila clavipes]
MLNLHISCKDSGKLSDYKKQVSKLDDLYIGFQLIRWFPQGIPVYRAETNLQMERRGLQSCQSEAELILEANRLQLMRTRFRESGECLLEQFHFEEVEDVTWVLRLQLMEIQMARMITKGEVTPDFATSRGPISVIDGRFHCFYRRSSISSSRTFKQEIVDLMTAMEAGMLV